MIKRQTFFIILIGLAFAGAGFYFNAKRLTPGPAAADAATMLFAQQLPDATSGPTPLSKWKGRVLVVNFWATWCPPCVEEMPELTALQNKLAQKNIQIIGIGIDSAQNIQDFSAKFNIGYPLYIAGMEGTGLTRAFGNSAGGLPFTVLIDQKGAIVKTYTGRLNIENLERDILALDRV